MCVRLERVGNSDALNFSTSKLKTSEISSREVPGTQSNVLIAGGSHSLGKPRGTGIPGSSTQIWTFKRYSVEKETHSQRSFKS